MKPIPKVSKKREQLNRIYEKVRIEVLSEAKFKCFIDGCKNVANTCEHRMGRKGYADEWARENNIPLLIDKRYLAPCCNFHNLELENNPELSKQYQLSKIHGGKKT
jgi:alanine-alpha-ketoisovalerate/valine-pyruvate aminotransferase